MGEVLGRECLGSEKIGLVTLGRVRGEDGSRLRSEGLEVSFDECSYIYIELGVSEEEVGEKGARR